MEKFDIFRLDWHTLRVFLSVCETRSISRTADIFDLNQSTISHTIDKMRAAVGDQLFVKVGRGIIPTAVALETAPKVQEILVNIEGLVASADYDAARDTTPIIIAIPTPALMLRMRTVFNYLRHAAPNAEFRIARLAPRQSLADMLNDGEVDLAISINMTKFPASLNATHCGEDELVINYDLAVRGPVETPHEFAHALHGIASSINQAGTRG